MDLLQVLTYLVWLVGSVTFILALKFLASPATARRGNQLGAAGMALIILWTFFTVDGQSASIAGQLAAIEQGTVAGWVLTHGDEIVGRVNLNNLVMGVLRSASIGYWTDLRHLGRGLASEGDLLLLSDEPGLGVVVDDAALAARRLA